MKILIWLLALALPIQGLAVATLEIRGPAHFHTEPSEGGPHPGHAHARAEHHHHAAADGAIEVDDDDENHRDVQALWRNDSGSFAGVDTLTQASFPAVIQRRAGAIASAGLREPLPPFPTRLERPPTPPAGRFFR